MSNLFKHKMIKGIMTTYKCNKCGMEYYSRMAMESHKEEMHYEQEKSDSVQEMPDGIHEHTGF